MFMLEHWLFCAEFTSTPESQVLSTSPRSYGIQRQNISLKRFLASIFKRMRKAKAADLGKNIYKATLL